MEAKKEAKKETIKELMSETKKEAIGEAIKEPKKEAIIIENLIKKYDKKEALKNINLTISEGEFYCLMGPNGSGKTTLSAILASVREKTSGTVKIYGAPPDRARNLIGYMPQENFSSALLTGRENLIYFAGLLGNTGLQAKKIAEDLLGKVGLKEDADKLVSKYSGGMRKRLELATILFTGIKVLILDEPTTGLDPTARKNFFELVNDTRENNITIFLITHIGTDAEMADRIGLIDEGRLIAEGTPDELKRNNNLKNALTIEANCKNERIKSILYGFSDGDQVVETDLGYKIYSDDIAEDIPEIIRKIDREGFTVTRLESTTSTLDDVFYKLTGHSIKDRQKIE
ncbi:MAG: ABC transporter ATP-binding protein [Actinobacteria bacterium]|nr:ABC transporter ATP-binding protein [Actinomycetota bacterium]